VLVLENANLSVQTYVEPSTIGGNVLADHCAFTNTIGGNLQCQQNTPVLTITPDWIG
jgi:hypothetical protein